MSYQIRLLIYKNKSVFDDIIISSKSFFKYGINFTNEELEIKDEIIDYRKMRFYPMSLRKDGFNAYLISVYTYTMNQSDIYRKSAINVLINFIKARVKISEINPIILIKLRTPKPQFLDYKWNERLTQMIMERQEIDHAMSWLSTLGGAFSSLGDEFNHCAKVAGKISVLQFKLSMRLGDAQLVARCKLYAALSLIQQGYLKTAKQMIQEIFKFSVSDKDIRLQRMCEGVWAKLKYCYTRRKKPIHKPNNLLTCY